MMCIAELGSSRAFVGSVNLMETDNQGKEEGNSMRVKFLCSFGGSILPRPSDGKLRYAGGETRIVSVNRDVNYRELMAKLKELCEMETLTLKYQQPDDDLDALVSVLSDEDVCHMMDEYDRLEAGDGVSSRLRLFLFGAGEQKHQQQNNFTSAEGNDDRDAEQRYVEALNSVAEMSRQQFENHNNGNNNFSSNNNSSSSNNSNSLLVGNGSEAGIAQHVSVALPVSSMKPFSKGGGSAASSPPSSPSHLHHHPHHHHKQVSAPDQFYRKQISYQHHQHAHNSTLAQLDVQAQSLLYFPYTDNQGHEYSPKGQSELNSHHQYASHHHMPRHDSFQNIQGLELPPQGQPEISSHQNHHQHHHECVLHARESFGEFSAVPRSEIPSKGQIEVGGHHLRLSHRVESYQETPLASVVEFPLKGQSEGGSYHQHLPHPHKLQQDISALPGVDFPFILQAEVGYHQQHVSHLQSDAGSHLQHVLTNMTSLQHQDISGLPRVEFPQKGQSNVGSEINSGFANIREYKQSVVDAFVPHVESLANLQQLEQQHFNVQSEVGLSDLNCNDGELHNIPSRQCNCQTCYWQQEMPFVYHQVAENSLNKIHHDQELNSGNYQCEFALSNPVQKRTFQQPLGRQPDQLQHKHNDNELQRGAFNDHQYMYKDHHESVHSNLLQNNTFQHSTVGQVEQQLSCNDNEFERSWNASYYASGPQHPDNFSHMPHPANALDFSLAPTSIAHEANSVNIHQRYLGKHHNVQFPWVCDEYGNRVYPSSNNNISGDNHVTWNCQPHFAEKDIRFQGQNLSQLEKTFEGNSLSQQQYAGVQSRQNISEAWVPNLYSKHSLPYSDQCGPDNVKFQKVQEYGQYCPVESEELPLQILSPRVDQRMYSAQQPYLLTGFQDGQEKAKERVLHGMNDQLENVRILIDGMATGAHALGEDMHNGFERNNPWDHYSRDYQGLHPDVIENNLDGTFGIHLQPNNGRELEFHMGREYESANSVLGKRYDQDTERMEHDYISIEMNTSKVTDFPDYMPKDVLQKNTNTSDSDSHCFTGSNFTREIEDIKHLTIDPIKRHTSFQSESGITCVTDAFPTADNNQILSTLDKNQMLSTGTYSHAVTSMVDLTPDKSNVLGSSAIFPSVSSSALQRSDNMISITLPIYDQSPANSTTAVLPESLWSETEDERKFSELDKNVIIENKRMMSTTEQLAAEHNLCDLKVPKQNEIDNGNHEDCLNRKAAANSCSTSRPVESSLHGPSIPSSFIASTTKILDKQNSAENEKEVATGMVDKEVKDEDIACTSDGEENIPQEEATENNPLGLNADSGSVDMARRALAEAEAQALAKGLQTIRNADLEEIRELGSGTYGTVYYGKWKGSDVAIKRIKASCFEGRPSERGRLIADFWREASILSQLHHPNVVSFYGVVRDGPGATLATVTEYMVNGSLKQVLRKKDRTIDRRKRLILAMDAAFGMEYLHEKNVVHFDLKCENLLVNMRDPHRPICKIGDMGLSKVKHQTLVSGGVRGTLPWMAPELLSGRSGVSDKIDVYSFGIVMWELLTGDEPYSNMHCGSIIGGIMKNTLRPPVPDWCEPAWRSLMERCWSAEPGERPPFAEISKELRAVAASMNVK